MTSSWIDNKRVGGTYDTRCPLLLFVLEAGRDPTNNRMREGTVMSSAAISASNWWRSEQKNRRWPQRSFWFRGFEKGGYQRVLCLGRTKITFRGIPWDEWQALASIQKKPGPLRINGNNDNIEMTEITSARWWPDRYVVIDRRRGWLLMLIAVSNIIINCR